MAAIKIWVAVFLWLDRLTTNGKLNQHIFQTTTKILAMQAITYQIAPNSQ